jgi:hypothetical protein
MAGLNFNYQPYGGLGALLQGQEDATFRSRRAWEDQQSAEKQAADIENSKLGKELYRAQIEAQRANILAQQQTRDDANAYKLQQAETERESRWYPQAEMLAELSRVNPYLAAMKFNQLQQAGMVPKSYETSMRPDEATFEFVDGPSRQQVMSRFDPEVANILARNALRNKGITTQQVAQGKNETTLSKTDQDNQTKLEIERIRAENRKQLKDMDLAIRREVEQAKAQKNEAKLEQVQTRWANETIKIGQQLMTETDPTRRAQLQAAMEQANQWANFAAAQRQAAAPTPMETGLSPEALQGTGLEQRPARQTSTVPVPQVGAGGGMSREERLKAAEGRYTTNR